MTFAEAKSIIDAALAELEAKGGIPAPAPVTDVQGRAVVWEAYVKAR